MARKYTLLALPISIRNHCGRPTVIYEGLACHSSIKLLSSSWKKREVMLLVIDSKVVVFDHYLWSPK